jgi:hypothetical protein
VCESQGYKPRSCRSVAQSGRALRSGRRGRRFKSCHSDQFSRLFDVYRDSYRDRYVLSITPIPSITSAANPPSSRSSGITHRHGAAMTVLDPRKGITDSPSEPPPNLQDLVVSHGGYNRIPQSAWATYDAALAAWQERVRLGYRWQR